MKMKQFAVTAILSLTLIVSACGKNNQSTSADTSAAAAAATVPPCTVNCGTNTFTNTSTGTGTGTGTGQPPLTFTINQLGASTVFTTGSITTDNVLKARFVVTAGNGNHVWQASELKVTVVVNGIQFTPTYTSSNYIYGQISDGPSNLMDFSSYITPGQPVTITVENPSNDFYCTYPYNNPLFEQYPGCRKTVFATHYWAGQLIVQTSATQSI